MVSFQGRNPLHKHVTHTCSGFANIPVCTGREEEEEEEEEDLFVFNHTIEGPRATAVKSGRITQA